VFFFFFFFFGDKRHVLFISSRNKTRRI